MIYDPNMSSRSLEIAQKLNSGDSKLILSALSVLRSRSTNTNSKLPITADIFQIVVSMLKQPNHFILSYALSILGNLCRHDVYRQYFSATQGVNDLLIVTQSIDNDDIVCRTWRLIANLSASSVIFREFLARDIFSTIKETLSRSESFSKSISLTFSRAIKKLTMRDLELARTVSGKSAECIYLALTSNNKDIVTSALDVLAQQLLDRKAFSSDPKAVMDQLVVLSKEMTFYEQSIKCLSVFICHRDIVSISRFLENSGVEELFILHIKSTIRHEKAFMRAFAELCRQSAMRCKIKEESMFSTIIPLFRNHDVRLLLQLLKHFQYDTTSVYAISQCEEIIPVLMKHINDELALVFLRAIAKQDRYMGALVTNENLDIFIRSRRSNDIFSILFRSQKYFKTILLSGKIWAARERIEIVATVDQDDFRKGVIEHCLVTGDTNQQKIVSLAVPFLVPPRSFRVLYDLLARHEAMPVILNALKTEKPLTESTAATVVKLASIFRRDDNINRNLKIDFNSSKSEIINWSKIPTKSEVTRVLLDDGRIVLAPKEILCSHSDVFDRMLNGHFAEAGQDCVRLRDCSRAAFLALIRLLQGNLRISSIEITTHLELISLSDRLLIPGQSDALTSVVEFSEKNCVEIYLWARTAGHSPNVSLLREKAYWTLLSNASMLQYAVNLESSRDFLLSDICEFLTSCLNDLL